MRFFFVNYSHPDIPHVSGMRLRCFAESLAQGGHQIVLLTRSLRDGEGPKPPEEARKELAAHNWRKPYVLPCAPKPNSALGLQRGGRISRLRSKMIVVWHYLAKSGVFDDWVEGTRPYWGLLAAEFKPDITWATFGNTDSWVVAQGVARIASIPWVMDIKDGWDPFIPRPLRALIAARFKDGAWMTSNSDFSARVAKPWFRQSQTTVYSGVAPEFLDCPPQRKDNGEFRIVLSGGLYREPVLKEFLAGLRGWLERLAPTDRSRVTLAYAGANAEILERNRSVVESFCRLEVHDYLPFPKFMQLIRAASVNAYLWLPTTFHHKLIELLTCNRPIIAFPGEHEESKAISRQVSGDLNCCETRDALATCLENLWRQKGAPKPNVNREALRHFTWEAQAKKLLQVFNRVLAAR